LEDVKEMKFELAEDFLVELRRKFGRKDNESANVVELKRMKSRAGELANREVCYRNSQESSKD